MLALDTPTRSRHFIIRFVAVVFAALAIFGILRSHPVSEGDGNTPIPLDLFAQAREGDWAAYVVATTADGRREDPEHFASHVIRVQGDTVTTRVETRRAGGPLLEGATRDFSSRRAPTVSELLAPPNTSVVFEHVRISPERRSIANRAFDCLRVAYDRTNDGGVGGAVVHVVAWIAAEVPAGGVVAVEATGTDAQKNVTRVTWELAGFGNGPKVTFGLTLDEIARPPSR